MRSTSRVLSVRAITLAAALALCACGAGEAVRKRHAVEAALQVYGNNQFPTGRFRATTGIFSLGYLGAAQAAGLLTIREIPESYWDSFLTTTQGGGKPVEVVPTKKLRDVAVDSQAPPNGVFSVRGSKIELEEIVSELAYTGPLATVGEKYELLVGIYKQVPTAAAEVLGPSFSNTGRYRFRCVLWYNASTREWSVKALDFGAIDTDSWYTDNVK